MSRLKHALPVAAFLTSLATPLIAQQAGPEPAMPRGTYLIYAQEGGVVFVSYEASLAASNIWPMAFYYFREGIIAGSARMRGAADCTQGIVRGRLTDATGEDGAALPIPEGEAAPTFAFDSAGNDGDRAIVSFACGRVTERLVEAERPIDGSPDRVADSYRRLLALGLSDRLSRSLAIRSVEEANGLIETAVPETQRETVRAILGES